MTPTQLSTKMLLDRWNAVLSNSDKLFDSLSDDQLAKEIAPGKNRGIYLLGHLIAVHDDMLRLLDLGAKQHDDLFEIFVKSPDKAVSEIPSAQELRKKWKDQVAMLNQKFSSLSDEQWFERHTAVTPEEFVNEPHRNKLNIILTRSTHLAHHVGQLELLK